MLGLGISIFDTDITPYLCEQGVGQGEEGMFTQRVKAVWSCLCLMLSQSQVGHFNFNS